MVSDKNTYLYFLGNLMFIKLFVVCYTSVSSLAFDKVDLLLSQCVDQLQGSTIFLYIIFTLVKWRIRRNLNYSCSTDYGMVFVLQNKNLE